MRRAIGGLAGACHPMPSLAVTVFATALGAAAGLSLGRVVILAVAILSGQLTVGWLNDDVDRRVDAAAARSDKPLVRGTVELVQIRVAFAVAFAICVISSFALGVRPGLLHLVAVGSAYSYDLALKSTMVSWLPFAVSFGILPAVVSTAGTARSGPGLAVTVAGAALGVAAHLANTVKDTEADALTGVRGLPQVIGPHASLIVAAALIAVAGVAVALTSPHPVLAWGCAVAALVAAVIASAAGRRVAFAGTVIAAGIVVVGLVAVGGIGAGG